MESIFTGLNHLNIISVLDEKYSEHFGFTLPEATQIMSYYGAESRMEDLKAWYNGYLFGNTQILTILKKMQEKHYNRLKIEIIWKNFAQRDIAELVVGESLFITKIVECAVEKRAKSADECYHLPIFAYKKIKYEMIFLNFY